VMKSERFSEKYLQFTDNEGLRLELVEREEGSNSNWSFGGVSADEAIKGFGGAVLFSVNPEKTMDAIEHLLGFKKIAEDAGYARYRSTADIGNVIDVPLAAVDRGSDGAGTVHHIAWRAKDFEQHAEWRSEVEQYGYHPTPIIDRQYFNALYFREAGGILFEIATDPPGFAKDEPADALGEKIMLPEWFEPDRSHIEANLLPLEVKVLEGIQK
jgi:glyoxalase family protein